MGASSSHKPFAAEKVERLDQFQVHGTISRTYVYGCYDTSNEHDVSRIVGQNYAEKGKERREVVLSLGALKRRMFSLGPSTSPFQPHLVSLALWQELRSALGVFPIDYLIPSASCGSCMRCAVIAILTSICSLKIYVDS
jgi:hypothetical protein